ncbi:hypothetical protein An02g07990 [Aspergillus niger]|uniref:Uncharacterized protein n=2 Tax=Aspergillus niger TaxID=5061 RepID=A2QDR1_ASPNC|nr:hypothetical protein An02g07990 [Aspergillus niger]CAK37762.1 hypothetical protein An02g07990 [Aspergillus niger]
MPTGMNKGITRECNRDFNYLLMTGSPINQRQSEEKSGKTPACISPGIETTRYSGLNPDETAEELANGMGWLRSLEDTIA